MHGRVQRDSESCRSLQRSSGQHMRSLLPLANTNNTTVVVAGDIHSATTSTTSDSFLKDGRKISVGDCALFKPPKDYPPLIGLIRWLGFNKENNFQLGVNWLYRSSELTLEKVTAGDSAPNEIFYSFHKDEIPVASLLHPCKVAFLPRGVELPKGTFAFVCRRAYDIADKCVWWLTDQDYINEQQEEVDRLLYNARIEMHVGLQPVVRSPKQAQLKSASDSGLNSGSSFPSQPKGKKRDRGDHGADPLKRERSSRTNGGDLVQCKTKSNLKHEIARIREKSGVLDLEGVEKLVQLMQTDRADRDMDLVSRSMLAGVMASIDKVDCLNLFVQLRGLPVLDEWVQDIHKGKIGNDTNLKDGDKSVEEFLLVLLRALDKLPINLRALQMCNIGRSVNHLRSHKNIDIQRKARSLVDTWKKRVEVEMISIDAKSASTHTVAVRPSKSRLPEASHGLSGTPSESDAAIKSSIAQNSASKTSSVRSSHGESSVKYATSSPGPAKPASSIASEKENQSRTSVGGTAGAPQIREERSSSSNQSHSYGQSSLAKEDLNSTTGSLTVNSISSSSTRSQKFSGSSATGSQIETSYRRTPSSQKSTAFENKSRSALTSEKVVEGPGEGSSHKLIVKIPKLASSPARGGSGGYFGEPTFMSSRVSSPALLNKHEQSDYASMARSCTYRFNVEADVNAYQSNDSKEVFVRSEDAVSPAVLPDEDQSTTIEGSKRFIEGPPNNQLESFKLKALSFSPMNALVESCAKYSEATSSLSPEDKVGMNLLASVAAGEMSRSDLVSLTDSNERSMPVVDVCTGDEAKSNFSPDYFEAGVQNKFQNDAERDGKKQVVLDSLSHSDDGLYFPQNAPPEFSGSKNCAPCHSSEDNQNGEGTNDFDSSSTVLRCNADRMSKTSEKPNENTVTTSLALPISPEKVRHSESNAGIHEEKAISSDIIGDGISSRSSGSGVMMAEEKDISDHLSVDGCTPMVEVVETKPVDGGDCTKFVNDGLDRAANSHQKRAAEILKSEFEAGDNSENLNQPKCHQKSMSESIDAFQVGEPDHEDDNDCISKSEKQNFHKEVHGSTASENHSAAALCLTSHYLNSHRNEANVENQKIPKHISVTGRNCPCSADNEAQKVAELTESMCASIQKDESASGGAGGDTSSATKANDPGARMKFDLNEGFSGDDVKYWESVTSFVSTNNHISPLPISVNSTTGAHSATNTVASAAKGAFVPPEDLLRSKLELGWKGSASTSAFRPAEPRKVLEMPLGPSNLSCPDTSSSKQYHILLDIDLNVPDERVLEELACRCAPLAADSTSDKTSNFPTLLNEASNSMPVRGSGVLDFDLNTIDKANDTGHWTTKGGPNGEIVSIVNVKTLGGLHVRRDFDLNDGLNDGLVADDSSVEEFSFNQLVKGGRTMSQLPLGGLRMNNPGMGNFSSWFPPGNTYPKMAIPSLLPDRGEQPFSVSPPGGPQRAYGRPTGVTPFSNTDIYHGSVLSSSPAASFPSNPYQFPVFPFGPTFPLPSAAFSVGANSYPDSSSGPRIFVPSVNSQYLGPVVGSVTSQFQRPYIVALPEMNNNGIESNIKWIRQGLDLNTGPEAVESRDREMWSLSSGQHPCPSSQALTEERARMFSVSGGILRRKEPEGGRDNETFRHKQSSRK